jgi:hypothetical protein
MLKNLTIALAISGTLFIPMTSQAQQPIGSYVALLSEADHFSFAGQRLTSAAAIIRQDRANYHRYGIRDPEDGDDTFFRDADNRDALEQMLERGRADPDVIARIVNGTTKIRVDIYQSASGPFIQVTLLDKSELKTGVFKPGAGKALTAPTTKRTTSPGLEIEAIELASNFILQAKLNNPRVFGPSETPVGLASHGAAWTADEGVGTVEIITEETRKGLDVATAVAAADSKDCGGKFASGRVSELVDSDVVFRGFASCDDSNGTRVTQHFIVPRAAGGFVIFSLSATGQASQPPSVTEGENLVSLRKAAVVSVEKK